MKNSPLQKIMKSRNLTLLKLYKKINEEISLVRLSDIRIAREIITDKEIEILNKYLNLTDDEVEMLEDMEIDKLLKENEDYFIELLKLVPENLRPGESVIKKCPRCGSNLRIAKASINGHLWITCQKEGILLCQ